MCAHTPYDLGILHYCKSVAVIVDYLITNYNIIYSLFHIIKYNIIRDTYAYYYVHHLPKPA